MARQVQTGGGFEVGDVVARRYEILKPIGAGGMGCVFSARDHSDDSVCALKVMQRDCVSDPERMRRFEREARVSQAIDSDYVARVYDAGRLEDGSPFMVMALLEGEGLDRVLATKAPLPSALVIRYALQVCVGLAAAHARGIVHRDLKPSNLFLTRSGSGNDVVKLLDFGIAKAMRESAPAFDAATLTATDSVLGSPRYLSPEQLRDSKRVDMRTDLWSLGLVVHGLLTGRHAFEADSVGELFAMIISEPATALREHLPGASPSLERIVGRCPKRDVARRYQDAGQLARDLAALGGAPGRALAAQATALLEAAGIASVAPGDDPVDSSRDGETTELAPSPLSPLSTLTPESQASREMSLASAMPPVPVRSHRGRAAALTGIGVAGIVAFWMVRDGAGPEPEVDPPSAQAGVPALEQPSIVSSNSSAPNVVMLPVIKSPPALVPPAASMGGALAASAAPAKVYRARSTAGRQRSTAASSATSSEAPAGPLKIKAKGPLVTPEDFDLAPPPSSGKAPDAG